MSRVQRGVEEICCRAVESSKNVHSRSMMRKQSQQKGSYNTAEPQATQLPALVVFICSSYSVSPFFNPALHQGGQSVSTAWGTPFPAGSMLCMGTTRRRLKK